MENTLCPLHRGQNICLTTASSCGAIRQLRLIVKECSFIIFSVQNPSCNSGNLLQRSLLLFSLSLSGRVRRISGRASGDASANATASSATGASASASARELNFLCGSVLHTDQMNFIFYLIPISSRNYLVSYLRPVVSTSTAPT